MYGDSILKLYYTESSTEPQKNYSFGRDFLDFSLSLTLPSFSYSLKLSKIYHQACIVYLTYSQFIKDEL